MQNPSFELLPDSSRFAYSLLILALVVTFIYIALVTLKKLNKSISHISNKTKSIKVIEKLAIDDKNKLALTEYNGKKYLLLIGANNQHLIDIITNEEEPAAGDVMVDKFPH